MAAALSSSGDQPSAGGATSVGIIGCGDILDAYMRGLGRFGSRLRVLRCADVLTGRASSAAARYGIPRWGGVDDIFSDDDVALVVSLTPPIVHHEIIRAAAEARKHVFTEKPLAATVTLAQRSLPSADAHGVVVGCAPDTFLGSAAQTARAAIDGGSIGQPVACTAFSPYSRAERRHPNPAFLFGPGAGPLMDTAPYFVTALVNLFGPIESVAGLATKSHPTRRVLRADGRLMEIDVAVPTHATALLRFGSGIVGTFISSFDIWDHHLPEIEIYGTEGTLSLPHPNWYDGDVKLKPIDGPWQVLPPVTALVQSEPREKIRGLGLVDLVESLDGHPHRSSSALGLHTLEALEAIQRSSDMHQWADITNQCSRPEAMNTTT